MKKLIIVSGYFNPLHKGHLELFEKAKEAGDLLCVIVNNDKQREMKGSKFFMDEEDLRGARSVFVVCKGMATCSVR